MARWLTSVAVSGLIFANMLYAAPGFAQIEARITPLWEGIEKSEEDLENDAIMVERLLEITNGDRIAATEKLIDIGWQRIAKQDANHAILAFNQASLITPDYPKIFPSLAIATHLRGDDFGVVERWIDRSLKTNKRNAQVFVDMGRIYGERGKPEIAKTLFEASLAISPEYSPAHLGMVQVAKALGNESLQAQHQQQFDKLTGKTSQ